MATEKVWTHAEITYRNGVSFSIRNWKFFKNTPKRCTDRDVAKIMKGKRRTSVQDYFKDVKIEGMEQLKPTLKVKATKVKKER